MSGIGLGLHMDKLFYDSELSPHGTLESSLLSSSADTSGSTNYSRDFNLTSSPDGPSHQNIIVGMQPVSGVLPSGPDERLTGCDSPSSDLPRSSIWSFVRPSKSDNAATSSPYSPFRALSFSSSPRVWASSHFRRLVPRSSPSISLSSFGSPVMGSGAANSKFEHATIYPVQELQLDSNLVPLSAVAPPPALALDSPVTLPSACCSPTSKAAPSKRDLSISGKTLETIEFAEHLSSHGGNCSCDEDLWDFTMNSAECIDRLEYQGTCHQQKLTSMTMLILKINRKIKRILASIRGNATKELASSPGIPSVNVEMI